MSFLDQLAKNLNTQTEFFTQLSNISKNSRVRTTDKPELELKQKADVQSSKEANDSQIKDTQVQNKTKAEEKEDFKVEKENFFSTAKKVFKEYKVKADKSVKEKDEPKLQDELETADQALDLIFGLVDPQLQAQIELQSLAPKPDLSAALEALEIRPDVKEPDPELLDFFLDRIDLKVSSEIETLTKEIVNLDLNSSEGIAEILEISNNIENLQNIEKAINEIKTKLESLVNIEVSSIKEKEIRPEVELLLESKIDTKLSQLKQADTGLSKEIKLELKREVKSTTSEGIEETIKPEAKIEKELKIDLEKASIQLEQKIVLKQAPKEIKELQITVEETESSTIKKVLDEVKASLKQERAVKDLNTNKPETNTNNFNVKVLQESETRISTNKDLNYTKAQVEVLDVKTAGTSDTQQESDFSNDNFETLFPREIKVSNIKIKSLTTPVAIKQLPEVVTKEALDVKPGAKQEVKMILDPDNLGKMQLSLTREDNQIHISMVVRTDEAQTKLEQKINDIKAVLKEKGFEANIEVTKSDTNNSNQSQQNQGNTSQGNEAKQEQKEKYLNQVPQWISKDAEKLDFTEALNRAL
jgi:flagellar hook-length control protein FliK